MQSSTMGYKTIAIILSTRPHIAKKAKEALVNLKRDALNVPKGWLTFNGPSLLKGVEGEGEVFRAFDCDCPVQNKPGILFEQKERRTPHLTEAVEDFREGECDILQKMPWISAHESGTSSCTALLGQENRSYCQPSRLHG